MDDYEADLLKQANENELIKKMTDLGIRAETKAWNAALDEAIKIATIERKYTLANEIRKLKK